MASSTAGGRDKAQHVLSDPATRVLLAVVSVAIILRVVQIDLLPIWLDEGFSLWFSRQSIAFLWSELPKFETHPPLYYALLHFWTAAFGTTEAGLRSLSLVAGLASLVPVYAASRIASAKLGPAFRWTPVMAVSAMAINAFQIDFAGQARPYSLLCLAVATAMLGALRVLRRDTDRTGWVCLVAGMALTCWFHALGPLYVGAIGLALAIAWWLAGRDARFFARLVVAAIAVAALYAPISFALLDRAGDWSTSTWVPAPRLRVIVGAVIELYGVDTPSRLLAAGLTLVLLVFAGLGAATLARADRGAALVLVLLWILPFATSLAVSFAVAPVFLSRTLLPTAVPFFVLLAVGLSAAAARWRVAARWRAVGAAAVLGAYGLGTAALFATPPAEDWRAAAHLLAQRTGPRDIIVVLPNTAALPLDYYLGREARQVPLRVLPRRYPAAGLPNPYPSGGAGEPGVIAADVAGLADEVRQQRTPVVWVVTRERGLFDPAGHLQRAFGDGRTGSLLRFGRIRIDAYRLSTPVS